MITLKYSASTLSLQDLSSFDRHGESGNPVFWDLNTAPVQLGWRRFVYSESSNTFPMLLTNSVQIEINPDMGGGVLVIPANSTDPISLGIFGGEEFYFIPKSWGTNGYDGPDIKSFQCRYGNYLGPVINDVSPLEGGDAGYTHIYVPYHIVKVDYLSEIEIDPKVGDSRIMYMIAFGAIYGQYFTEEQAYSWTNDLITSDKQIYFYRGNTSISTYIGNQTNVFSNAFRGFICYPLFLRVDGSEVPDFETDPFAPGGGTGSGGGGGNFDNTSTPIEIPNLPSISAANTGFISLFNPSLAQLIDLSGYLWSDLFEIDGWKKLFADPMDAILGLSILPVAIPSGGTREVKVGNIGTGISLTVAASQFVEVDCGSIDVNEYWGAYLDYEPYTQAQIFLPYIGTRPISVDEIMGKTVRVVYHVDILTGACCCFVKCGDSVLYTYNGQCSIPIPVTGANYASVVNGVINIAASVGSLVATRGTSAPTAVPSIASSAINQMKPSIEKSGAISGSAGILNMQTPYLILIRPRQALPSKQNEFIGYPSLITVQLAELSGYTEVQSIHLENIPATQEELAEIQSLLEGGVIF